MGDDGQCGDCTRAFSTRCMGTTGAKKSSGWQQLPNQKRKPVTGSRKLWTDTAVYYFAVRCPATVPQEPQVAYSTKPVNRRRAWR